MNPPKEPEALAAQVNQLKSRELAGIERDLAKEEAENPIQGFRSSEVGKTEEPCESCGMLFTSFSLVIEGRLIAKARHCEPCVASKLREISDFEARRLGAAKPPEPTFEERWAAVCPPLYASPFDPAKLLRGALQDVPAQDQEKVKAGILSAIKEVQAHPFGYEGLGLVGPTGRGKTRIMFTLIKKLFYEGFSCKYVNVAAWGRECSARFASGSDSANAWINGFCKADVLFLDDLGKEKLTDRVESELYGIIEARSAYVLPIYFTANAKGKALIKKMTVLRDGAEEVSDRAAPIVRRLQEFCKGIAI